MVFLLRFPQAKDTKIFCIYKKKAMAAASSKKQTSVATFRAKPKKRRKGIVSKTKTSKNKNSKLYKKTYKGQGR